MWISWDWYSFGHLEGVNPYYEKDDRYQPSAYPGLLSSFAIIGLGGDVVSVGCKSIWFPGASLMQ
jgi:hypothetical protein